MLFFVIDNKKRDFLCTKNMHKKSRFNVYIGYPIPGLLRRTDENRHMHSMKLLDLKNYALTESYKID